jgi:hypothetical protein
MRARTTTLLAALALAGAAGAANEASPFPAPLTLSGAGPYYTLRVPMALQSAARREDLGDLRVRNAGGEPLAIAWLPERTQAESPQQAAAAIYPVPAPPAAPSAPPSPRRWIVDTGASGFTLERLALTLAAGTQGVYDVDVEASDDLQHWRLVQSGAQLVQLAPQAASAAAGLLRSTEVELGEVAARYLRLATAAGAPAPALEGATVLRSRRPPLEPALEWSAPIAPVTCDEHHCDYALPRNVPIERLQVLLAEPGTVGVLAVLARVDPPAATSPYRHHHHLLRGSLDALHAKERPAPDAGWAWLAETNAYWLRDVGGRAELRSPPLRLDAGVTPMLRLQAAGGMRLLGRSPPALRIGAHASTLVFLARGPAPYRLELAPADEPPAALSLAQLMPARQPQDPLPTDTATPVVAVIAPPQARSVVVAPAAASSGAPWLWVALLGGVGLMGVMAWTLLRKR